MKNTNRNGKGKYAKKLPKPIPLPIGIDTPIEKKSSKKKKKAIGIKCPKCHCQDFKDEDGRPWETTHVVRLSGSIKRYRTCRNCGKRVVTRERIEGPK